MQVLGWITLISIITLIIVLAIIEGIKNNGLFNFILQVFLGIAFIGLFSIAVYLITGGK